LFQQVDLFFYKDRPVLKTIREKSKERELSGMPFSMTYLVYLYIIKTVNLGKSVHLNIVGVEINDKS
jgi:hypothetical protein